MPATFANFTYNNAGPFTATIDWGDGTAQGSTIGVGNNLLTVVSNGGNSFSITGTHTYTEPNNSGVTVVSPVITVTSADGATGSAVGQVTVVAPAAVIPAGLSMITVPFDYSGTSDTAQEVLGLGTSNALATWTGSAYAIYPNLPGLTGTQTQPGIGYWVREASAEPVVILGTPVAGSFTLPLHAGWNQIGDPYTVSVPLSSLTFHNATVGSALFAYDPLSNTYVSAAGLQPFQGYWIFITPTAAGSPSVTFID